MELVITINPSDITSTLGAVIAEKLSEIVVNTTELAEVSYGFQEHISAKMEALHTRHMQEAESAMSYLDRTKHV